MEFIYEDENLLITDALNQMKQVENVTIYGETNCSLCPRAASISFNIRGLDHGLVAAILNDYHNIAVRNECFCAHPYVKEMVIEELMGSKVSDDYDFEAEFKIKAGMVRASFGIYSTKDDVTALVLALKDIVAKCDEYSNLYALDETGIYRHKTFKPNKADLFNVESFIDDYLQKL
ncbi:aminotransferase class V-fold PLP-dependent enzyme, partial [bacterium]|nr:aminotransferase class V-fold PLP-dependent enzyme [bacterium]